MSGRPEAIRHPDAVAAGAPTLGHGHPASSPGAVGSVRADGHVYRRAPMLVYWETTLACGLACRHCRAEAMPTRSPDELTTAEGLRLLDAIAGFGRPYPHVVFTGGDPLRRPDLEALVAGATARGIGASLAPAVTPDLTEKRLAALGAAGIQTISLSLDGSSPERHDGLRGVPGTFEMTLRAADWARAAGLPIQVNTLVTDATLPDLPAIYDVLADLGILRWSLFFLISVGRGALLREVSPGESERLGNWLYEQASEAPFQIKTTEATHYRRIAIERMRADGRSEAEIAGSPVGRGFGIRDGNGILFVRYDGVVYPSGFLPLPLGNVRTDDLVTLYREHPVLVDLRNVGSFKGRCGRCSYGAVCGGSRARAFAWTGDPLESDPLCPYVPPLT